PADLPEDWRGLTGLTAVWISEGELAQLSPEQRYAVHHWVCRGGKLYVCNAQEVPAQFRATGFGTVHPLASSSIDVDATAQEIKSLGSDSLEYQVNESYAAVRWNAQLGEIALNV